ncbi:tyrosine-type recombinase/integrase [Synechococcus sp. HIMB2401]|uniref:tyrosine-type recombinase/integrase n=1 Tax=Synechococcus sp. HIMB2401 TaxID=3144208 RepID=UPI0036F31420
MDKAEALAFVSRMFDTAAAGAVLWGDALLMKRFLSQCSRSGSAETVRGYKREPREFTRWRDRNHPHLHLREINAAFCQDWVSQLREQVAAGELMPRSFNRRVSAVSALYRWASEPTRAAVTGVPRNPIPRRTGMSAPKLAKPLAESDLKSVLDVISAAKLRGSAIAARDYVMVRGSYLLGCRVSELSRLRWEDIEPLDEGGNVRLLGKGSKPRTIRVSTDTLKLFESLGRGEPGDWLFPSNKRNGPLTRQAVAARMAMWGQEANVRLHPHRCRHTHATHAIRRGVDVFTLSATLGHSSTGTTSHYVLAEPGESSSLKLG